jgi:hypothetical protein
MVEGTFTFLLFLFSSPQQAVIKQLDGYWLVTADNTEQVRDWNRIYYFEKCKRKPSEECEAHYGWAEFEGVYLNLYDKNFITFDVVKDTKRSKKQKLVLGGETYDFVLNLKQNSLRIFNPDGGDLRMEMQRVRKKEIRKSAKEDQLITTN